MKRSQPLVGYGSSDDEDTKDVSLSTEVKLEPPLKKRKLPALSSAFVPAIPIDNPSLHQGRIRTTPHVEGQYIAHIYFPVKVDPKSKLSELLRRIFTRAKSISATLHPIGILGSMGKDSKETSNGQETELHISVSRPIYLRAHQREDLKRAVRNLAKSRHGRLSLPNLSLA